MKNYDTSFSVSDFDQFKDHIKSALEDLKNDHKSELESLQSQIDTLRSELDECKQGKTKTRKRRKLEDGASVCLL